MRNLIESAIVIVLCWLFSVYGPDIPLIPEAVRRGREGEAFFAYVGFLLALTYILKLHLRRKGARR
jgi:hypothetical protein